MEFSGAGYMEQHYLNFDQPGINNTEELLCFVNEWRQIHKVSKIIISSTTGYTVAAAENILKADIPFIICKQDISEEYCMERSIYERIAMKYEIYDIPQKYLQSKISQTGTNILRKVSQGFKVCIELMEYMIDGSILKKDENVIVIAGTLRGADTAVAFKVKEKSYSVDRILCIPLGGVDL